jgi:hypothetical protein
VALLLERTGIASAFTIAVAAAVAVQGLARVVMMRLAERR